MMILKYIAVDDNDVQLLTTILHQKVDNDNKLLWLMTTTGLTVHVCITGM